MFERDVARARAAYARANISPLGSGALAGVPYPLDRERVAAELGMAGVTANSIDATADRDFAVEAVFVAALTMQHLSRLSEEIVIWSSAEFGYLQLDDAFTTGSSIMPQKKNPDVAELVRGKTGRVYGALMSLLTLLKGLPLAYNRDLQEDKIALFDAFDTAHACLEVIARMLGGLALDEARARAAAGGFALATELADYLAKRGVPFRQAHHVVGGIVRWCLEQGRDLETLTADELRRFSPHFGPDAPAALSVDAAVAARDLPGGTAPHRVAAALAAAADRITQSHVWLTGIGA
jgi:argininosuccinate lyase